jgi:hypothetical protein
MHACTYRVLRVHEWVVHGDNFNVWVGKGSAEDKTPDAPEAIDAEFNASTGA